MTSAPAIGFEYRPSRILRRGLIAIVLLAMTAILTCAWPWPAKAAALFATVAYALKSLRRWQGIPVAAVGWQGKAGWQLRMASGESPAAELRSCRVLGPAVVLRFAWEGGQAGLVLLPDNLDTDMCRRLRMRLSLPPV
ncbi:MAG TPA: protein YgfX [Luteibacter sp.]|jgi:toxin CptA|nr:protein YgfX [Luteibacter sp.]